MNKKFLAKLLIFCMVFTMIPMTAFAADNMTDGNGTYAVDGDTVTYTITQDTNINNLLTADNVIVSGTVGLLLDNLDMGSTSVINLTIANMTLKVLDSEKITFTVPTTKALTLENVIANEPVYIVGADVVSREVSTPVTVTINGGNYQKDVYVSSTSDSFVINVTGTFANGTVYIASGFQGTVMLDGSEITKDTGNVDFVTSDLPTGGGGSSSSNVSIATKVTGGKVTVTPTRPTRGQTVTITVTPADGYKLDTLKVTDLKGNEIELTKVSDTKYTFVMPAGKVIVTPTFVKIDGSDQNQNTTNVSKRFSDIAADAWYAEYINYVAENGLMNGYEDGRFGPNDQTTRAQIVTVLYRLEGEPAVSSSANFSDVSAGGQYYSSAVAWAARNNIVNGYEDGRFGPNDNVTREQIAAILYRYAAYKGYDTSLAGNIASFSDAARVSSWATDAIAWAVGEGLMNGDNGALKPQGNATRAEIATLLTRFCENIAK